MKNQMTAIVLAIALSMSPAPAVTLLDGEFTAWSFSATGTASVTLETSGGNPGNCLNVTTISGATVFGTAIKSDYTTSQSIAGTAFTLSLDVYSGPGAFGQGQTMVLLVEQGGNIYGKGIGVTGYPLYFDTLNFPGTFIDADFSRMLGSGPATPDFGGGISTRFGFAGGNSGSGELTQYYDNFKLEIIPEPALLSLLGSGVVVCLIRRKRQGVSCRQTQS